ncbi:MAG: acetylxylan esterase, partial [Myxococcota bacterium]
MASIWIAQLEPPYPNLPDPLVFSTGGPVRSVPTWETKRRGEVLELFRQHVYGRSPSSSRYESRHRVVAESTTVDGKAKRKTVQVEVRGPKGTHRFNTFVYLPKKSSGPVPVFILINHRLGYSSLEEDSEFFPVLGTLIPRGYGAALLPAQSVAPDLPEKFDSQLMSVFEEANESSWKTIAVWAFGASRLVDYLVTDSEVDGARIGVIGHSRGGKTALWAAAEDTRIAFSVANNSGCTGAALARRKSGELVGEINRDFPHWFADAYDRFNGKDETLPVDQHQLIALVAPRPVYITAASQDPHSDPIGMFYATVYAQPVYQLYNGLPKRWTVADFPEPGAVMGNGPMTFHLRPGEHDLTRWDWERVLDAADRLMP